MTFVQYGETAGTQSQYFFRIKVGERGFGFTLGSKKSEDQTDWGSIEKFRWKVFIFEGGLWLSFNTIKKQ